MLQGVLFKSKHSVAGAFSLSAKTGYVVLRIEPNDGAVGLAPRGFQRLAVRSRGTVGLRACGPQTPAARASPEHRSAR